MAPADGFGAHVAPPQEAPLTDSLAEQAVLAAILLNPKVLDALPTGFGARHFAFEDHGQIFEAAVVAAETGATMLSRLVEAALPHLAGPEGYVRSLYKALVSARPADVQGYAEALVRLAERRALAELAERVRAEALAGDAAHPVAAVVARAMDDLDRIAAGAGAEAPPATVGEAAQRVLAAAEEAHARDGRPTGIATGLRGLDEALGGMDAGQLLVLGARPAMGKSALAFQIAAAVARAGRHAAVFSLEMSAEEVAERLLAAGSGLHAEDIRRGRLRGDDWIRLGRAEAALRDVALSIDDAAGRTLAAIRLRCRALARRAPLALVVVDHIGLVAPPQELLRHGLTQIVEHTSNGLKRLAKEFRCPVLALCQLNRAVEGREDRRPGLADLRQSGAIEQDADAAMFLYREEYYLERSGPKRRPDMSEDRYDEAVNNHRAALEAARGGAELVLAKVRRGRTGTVELRFDGPTLRFSDAAEPG